MNGNDYAFAVARVRSNESRLLTANDLDQLLSSQSASAALDRLAANGWGDSSGKDDILETERAALWEFIDQIAPDPSVFDALRIPNDFHNLKAAIKAVVSGSDYEKLIMRPCTCEPSELYTAVSAANFDTLPEMMHPCAEEAYRAQLERSDGQLCDILIDRAALEASLAKAKEQGELLERIVNLRTFTANIKIAYRCSMQNKPIEFIERALAKGTAPDVRELAAAALEGIGSIIELVKRTDANAGEQLESSLSAFEKHSEQRELELARAARYANLSPDVLTAYIINREAEIRNVRIILTAQRNDIPPERARAMLRTAQV